MNEWTIRLIVALIFAAILAYQARGAVGRPMTRRAYTLGATAFLAFAALNLALMKRVKAVFNPSDALNPDKMFPDTRYCYESKRRLTAIRRGAAV